MRPKSESAMAVYAKTATSDERVALLRGLRREKAAMPVGFVRDALHLGLPAKEAAGLLAVCDDRAPDELEAMLLEDLPRLNPGDAVLRLDAWKRRTPRRAWPALVAAVPVLAARELGLEWLLDNVWLGGGRAVLDAVLAHVDRADFGPAALSRLFQRLVQWSVFDEPTLQAAERVLARTFETTAPDALLGAACAYVGRFAPDSLLHVLTGPIPPRHSADLVLSHHHLWQARPAIDAGVAALARRPPADADDFLRELYRVWPPTWLRASLSPEAVSPLMALVLRQPSAARALPVARGITWEFFAGLAPATLADALAKAPDPALAAERFGSLVATAPPPAAAPTRGPRSDNPVRSAFFDRFYRGAAVAIPVGDSPWRPLAENADQAAMLASFRRIPRLYAVALFQFVGREQPGAAFVDELLPLLPVLEPHELATAVESLLAAGTHDAIVATIRLLRRPGLDADAAFDVCALLATRDLTRFRGELQDALDDLGRASHLLSPRQAELLDAVRSLHSGAAAPPVAPAAAPAAAAAGGDDAEALVRRCPNLPADVVRSLRTAAFLQRSFDGAGSGANLDPSPAVELQYKAVELLLRHRFLPSTQRAIDDPRASLQRRLDRIGYGRAGRTDVEAFEAYLAALPAIRDIPRFGKQKLNRTLTALAQLRPGRRFSLDGLKAFMIFFLAFGRERCEHGLERLFAVGARSDAELLEFCRDLDTLHDIRNIAAHEGLATVKPNEIKALWSLTGAVIERIETYAARSA